jgi:hypothetical protein
MSAEIREQAYRNAQERNGHEWGKDNRRRIQAQDLPWQPCSARYSWLSGMNVCDAEPVSTTRERVIALNTEIDEIYDQLSILIAKRNNSKSDLGLESQIAELLKRLQARQKQEIDLIRTILSSPPSGAIAIGLSLLESADKLRAKYGHTPTSNISSNSPN